MVLFTKFSNPAAITKRHRRKHKVSEVGPKHVLSFLIQSTENIPDYVTEHHLESACRVLPIHLSEHVLSDPPQRLCDNQGLLGNPDFSIVKLVDRDIATFNGFGPSL